MFTINALFLMQHFLEDTEPLWEKHCLKEFKGCMPKGGQSWRDLYIVSLTIAIARIDLKVFCNEDSNDL